MCSRSCPLDISGIERERNQLAEYAHMHRHRHRRTGNSQFRPSDTL